MIACGFHPISEHTASFSIPSEQTRRSQLAKLPPDHSTQFGTHKKDPFPWLRTLLLLSHDRVLIRDQIPPRALAELAFEAPLGEGARRLVDLLGVAGEGGVTDVPSEQKDRHSRGLAGRKENILKASCPRKNLLRTVQKGAQKGAPSRKEKDPSRLLE